MRLKQEVPALGDGSLNMPTPDAANYHQPFAKLTIMACECIFENATISCGKKYGCHSLVSLPCCILAMWL
jgi:hypothetical protein